MFDVRCSMFPLLHFIASLREFDHRQFFRRFHRRMDVLLEPLLEREELGSDKLLGAARPQDDPVPAAYRRSAPAAADDRARALAVSIQPLIEDLREQIALLGEDCEILVISRARIHMMCGDLDTAFALLERSLQTPAGVTIQELRLGPTWDPLRADPRWQSLLAKFGGEK